MSDDPATAAEAIENGGARDPGPPPPPAAAENAASLLANLRGEHEESRAKATLDLPIPGFKGQLVCRYGVIPWEKGRDIATRAMRVKDHPRREINAWADELIAACEEFLVKQGDELVPVDPTRPVRYDQRLADGLEIELHDPPPGPARQVVFGVFRKGVGDEKADYALSAHHDELVDWMRGDEADDDDYGAEGDVAEEFAGK